MGKAKHDGHGMYRHSDGSLKHKPGSKVIHGYGKEIPANKFGGASVQQPSGGSPAESDGDDDGY